MLNISGVNDANINQRIGAKATDNLFNEKITTKEAVFTRYVEKTIAYYQLSAIGLYFGFCKYLQ